MARRSISRLATVVLVLALVGCGEDAAEPPVAPPPASLAELVGPWRTQPLRLDEGTWSQIEAVCRRDIEFPAGTHALLIDVRGAGVATVRMTGAQSGVCDALAVTPDGAVAGAGGGSRNEAPEAFKIPPGTTLGPIEYGNVGGGDLKINGWSVRGPAGAGIATVIVEPIGQPRIVATVMNGWFSAWWPVQSGANGQPRRMPDPPEPPPKVRIQGFDANGVLVNQIPA